MWINLKGEQHEPISNSGLSIAYVFNQGVKKPSHDEDGLRNEEGIVGDSVEVWK